MAPKIFFVFIFQVLIFKASSQVQPTLKQYLINVPQQQISTAQSSVPSQTKPASGLSALASLASLLTSAVSPSIPSTPPTNVVASAPSHHILTSAPSQHVVTTPTNHIMTTPTNHLVHSPQMLPQEKPSTSVDMELLNNLAIALQLMIVNNILSTSPAENPVASLETEKPPSFETIENLYNVPVQNELPLIASQYQSYQASPYEHQHVSQMPNSNFVGSSGFAGNPFMGSVPPPSPSRSGLTLMSPYEALSPSSPYMDPIISSPYGSVISSKKDFQSPYAAILGSDKDYFSMSSINDLF